MQKASREQQETFMVETEQSDFEEAVDFALGIATGWELTLPEQAKLFGYDGPLNSDVEAFEDRLKSLPAMRMKLYERISLIFDIKSKLLIVFDKRLEVEVRWLRVKQQDLGGKSIKDLLTSGSLVHLNLAASTVRAINV